jgi:hypothetical protein
VALKRKKSRRLIFLLMVLSPCHSIELQMGLVENNVWWNNGRKDYPFGKIKCLIFIPPFVLRLKSNLHYSYISYCAII